MTESFRLVSNMRKSILEARFDEAMGFTINFTIDTRSEDDQYCGISTGPRKDTHGRPKRFSIALTIDESYRIAKLHQTEQVIHM